MIRPVAKLLFVFFVVAGCASSTFAQTQVRLKLADGTYLAVDDAWESATNSVPNFLQSRAASRR